MVARWLPFGLTAAVVDYNISLFHAHQSLLVFGAAKSPNGNEKRLSKPSLLVQLNVTFNANSNYQFCDTRQYKR